MNTYARNSSDFQYSILRASREVSFMDILDKLEQ
jgi:hypothetical protein